eukprot:TRINITY_DN2507_c0_g1_i1.p1 TRINITY_DN2507_c0_g1~~TRINITY_DN2507_c0_g1_i1.p1  ORF type:complete len:309 (+),score=41.33 TRINITY_DN2507_c0_g1_i1:49-975(+)
MQESMDFIKKKMEILIGMNPVPFDDNSIISNRSVTYPQYDQRDLVVRFLVHELREIGVDFYIQSWTVLKKDFINSENYDITYRNVVVEIAGMTNSRDYVLIGAHYDVQNSLSHCWRGTIGKYAVTQGADDNGSGTVCCLELVRRFKEFPLDDPVRIVFFDGEEPGQFSETLGVGSSYHSLNNDDSLKLVYILDMVGAPLVDPNIGFTISIANIDPDKLKQACQELRYLSEYKFGITVCDFDVNYIHLTDSTHFASQNIPCVAMSNLAGTKKFPYYYHTEYDNIDIIDWVSFFNSINITEALLRRADWY